MENREENFSRYGKTFQEKLCHLMVEDRSFCDQMEEILSYNDIIDHIERSEEAPIMWELSEIIGNQGPLLHNHPNYNGMQFDSVNLHGRPNCNHIIGLLFPMLKVFKY